MAQTVTAGRISENAIMGSYGVLVKSFTRHLQAENKSPATIETYLQAVRALGAFLADQGMPTEPEHIAREHIETFLIDLQSRSKPGTVSTRFRGLQQFFKWLVEEGETSRDPMERMKRPMTSDEEATPILTEAQIRKLLKICDAKDFLGLRDTAIIRLLLDSGMRRNELAALKVEDVDWDINACIVMGKGRRPRACPFGPKTERALDRYLRIRVKHHHADSAALWIGRTGPITPSGVYQIVRDRAVEAGIGAVHPHMFRHTYAHEFRMNGGGEDDLMVLGGWRSRTMLGRYGKSAATERAREAHRRFSPGEKF